MALLYKCFRINIADSIQRKLLPWYCSSRSSLQILPQMYCSEPALGKYDIRSYNLPFTPEQKNTVLQKLNSAEEFELNSFKLNIVISKLIISKRSKETFKDLSELILIPGIGLIKLENMCKTILDCDENPMKKTVSAQQFFIKPSNLNFSLLKDRSSIVGVSVRNLTLSWFELSFEQPKKIQVITKIPPADSKSSGDHNSSSELETKLPEHDIKLSENSNKLSKNENKLLEYETKIFEYECDASDDIKLCEDGTNDKRRMYVTSVGVIDATGIFSDPQHFYDEVEAIVELLPVSQVYVLPDEKKTTERLAIKLAASQLTGLLSVMLQNRSTTTADPDIVPAVVTDAAPQQSIGSSTPQQYSGTSTPQQSSDTSTPQQSIDTSTPQQYSGTSTPHQSSDTSTPQQSSEGPIPPIAGTGLSGGGASDTDTCMSALLSSDASQQQQHEYRDPAQVYYVSESNTKHVLFHQTTRRRLYGTTMVSQTLGGCCRPDWLQNLWIPKDVMHLYSQCTAYQQYSLSESFLMALTAGHFVTSSPAHKSCKTPRKA